MAADAKLVTREDGLHAMHVMAVHAAHADMVHAAAEEAAELVVLIAYLAVGIESVALVGDGELIVIPEGLAGDKVACDLTPTGVAASAVLGEAIAQPWFGHKAGAGHNIPQQNDNSEGSVSHTSLVRGDGDQ